MDTPDSSSVMQRAYLGLGSNLGDSRAILKKAVQSLADSGELVGVSSLYRTEPIGGPEQDHYLNIVVALETSKTAPELLKLCQRLEQAADRVREVRWGPRTLDVDVLLVGDLVLSEPDLIVPHPRMTQRNFVMVPLLELAPELVIAGYSGSSVGGIENLGPL